MITKKEFLHYIDILKKELDKKDDFSKDMNKYFDNSGLVFDLNTPLFDAYVALLGDAIGTDKEWLEWFIWECNFGESDCLAYTDEDSTKIKHVITDASQMYDFLIEIKQIDEDKR